MPYTNIYINNRLITEYDRFTATFDNGQKYIFCEDEWNDFLDGMGLYCRLEPDADNFFETFKYKNFTYTDERKKL